MYYFQTVEIGEKKKKRIILIKKKMIGKLKGRIVSFNPVKHIGENAENCIVSFVIKGL